MLSNYIGGALNAPLGGRYLQDIEPATGHVYAAAPDSDASDLAQAVAAATDAFSSWSAAGEAERAAYLLAIAEGIERRAAALARAECIDTGKPLRLAAEIDIPRAATNFRFFAHAITQFSSESHCMGDTAINYTLRQPLGVVACISPWNLPIYLLSWKIAPALAAGNCVIAKPSEVTPMTAYLLSEICIEAGLPAGVLNILHGTGGGIGQALVSEPAVRAISFTGGTATGAEIARIAAPRFKRLSLELGGKNPTLIFGDCDFDAAIDAALRSAFSNQGQICLCGSRILVENRTFERFTEAFVARAARLTVGDPLDDTTDQGALVSEAHLQKVQAAVRLAREEGGQVLTGGRRITLPGRCRDGYFFEPTVITGLSQHCRTNQEEIFGPVVTLSPFADEDEAVAAANATEYGLSASVWSNDIGRCHRLARRLHSGVIWINSWLLRDLRTPFGGMKQSGVGREGGVDALRFFTEAKNVCIKIERVHQDRLTEWK